MVTLRNPDQVVLLTGTAHRALARAVAAELGVALGKALVGRFEDGEVRVRNLANVRGKHVFIVQPARSHRSIFELRLLTMAVRRSARRITLIVPYIGYARQDRMDQPGVPISIELVCEILAKSGAHDVMLVDPHFLQITGILEAYNEFLHVDVMYARPVILAWLVQQNLRRATICSSDIGGGKMVRSYWNRLRQAGYAVQLGVADKHGTSSSSIERVVLLGKFRGRDVYFIDDMATTGKTIAENAAAVKAKGARSVTFIAVHSVLPNAAACRRIARSGVNRFVTTDTLPIPPLSRKILGRKLVVVPIARLLALVTRALVEDTSVSQYFEVENVLRG